jgi:hypothetical protein
MKYIVYKTTCISNNKIYIGVHGTTDPNVFDGYIGNGININRESSFRIHSTPFSNAVLKYGITNFKREIISVFDNENDAYELEAKLVDESFVKRTDTYNIIVGGRQEVKNSKPKKKVYMYSLNGEFLMEFSGVNEAARYLNPKALSGGHLPRAIKNKHQYLGYRFSYEKVAQLEIAKHLKNHVTSKPRTGDKVGMFDDDNNLIKIFDNMTDCVCAGYKNAKLVALGKRKHCKGYIFKFINQDII